MPDPRSLRASGDSPAALQMLVAGHVCFRTDLVSMPPRPTNWLNTLAAAALLIGRYLSRWKIRLPKFLLPYLAS